MNMMQQPQSKTVQDPSWTLHNESTRIAQWEIEVALLLMRQQGLEDQSTTYRREAGKASGLPAMAGSDPVVDATPDALAYRQALEARLEFPHMSPQMKAADLVLNVFNIGKVPDLQSAAAAAGHTGPNFWAGHLDETHNRVIQIVGKHLDEVGFSQVKDSGTTFYCGLGYSFRDDFIQLAQYYCPLTLGIYRRVVRTTGGGFTNEYQARIGVRNIPDSLNEDCMIGFSLSSDWVDEDRASTFVRGFAQVHKKMEGVMGANIAEVLGSSLGTAVRDLYVFAASGSAPGISRYSRQRGNHST